MVAEEYDKDFLKKHDDDLNATLNFVSSTRALDELVLPGAQAGLFSAITSAFIVEVNSHRQHRDVRNQCSNSPAVGRHSPRDCPSLSHPVRQPCRFAIFGLPGNSWQTMVDVEQIRIDRHARVGR